MPEALTVPMSLLPPVTPFTRQVTPLVATPSRVARKPTLPPRTTVAEAGTIPKVWRTVKGPGDEAVRRPTVTVTGPVVPQAGTVGRRLALVPARAAARMP